jgi:hypothetical protein
VTVPPADERAQRIRESFGMGDPLAEEALDSLLAELQLARAVAEAAAQYAEQDEFNLDTLEHEPTPLARALSAYREGTRG